MPLKISRLPRARTDRIDLWLHIAADNMVAADRLTDRVDAVVEHLAEHPELGPERPGLGQGIRIFPVESLIVFYRIKPGTIEIIRILSAAQDITPDLLAE